MTNHRGGVLALTLFLIVAFAWTTLLVADVGRTVAARAKIQSTADTVVLSSVRLRAEALETIAARWREFGALFGAVSPSGEVSLASSDWPNVQTKADALKRALPGYQGRTTAVIKVVAEANRMERDAIVIDDAIGAQLGLTAKSITIRDEADRVARLEAAWYARQWGVADRLAVASPLGRHEVTLRFPNFHGDDWVTSTRTSAAVRWDVDTGDPAIAAAGNGGYARDDADAVWAGRLDPNRWPVFRTDLERNP